jgi:nucleoside-diphosphate-sugar epimerase
MEKKKILVCGATGFIGRNVAEHLSQRDDFEVYGTYLNSEPYENSKINFLNANLKNEQDVKEVVQGIDVIVQMAATTSGAKDITTKPYIHVTDNAVMNSLLLRSVFDEGVKQFIFPSCTVMYPSSETPLKETDFTGEVFPKYFGVGWTKVYVEKMCEFFSGLGKTKHTVIRHSNIYGPHDKFDLERSHVFGATMTKVMTAKDKLVIWGSGEEKRDLLYVSDLADFIERAIDKQESGFGLYNVGLGNAISIDGLVRKITSASGKHLRIENDLTKPTIKTSLCLDTTKAKTDFGWEPRVSLDEGILKTMKWYKENIDIHEK